MSKAIPKECMTLLKEASEMFSETGCVPGIDGVEVPAETIVPDAMEYIAETIDDPNLGPHGLDMFLHLTGEEAQVTGAQLSRRAHERPVEDYASVMLRSASGILGTVEVGNGFPRDGTDGEWKIAGRDAILTMKDGSMKLATADGDEILPSVTVTSPYFTAVRDALDRWQRGEEPRVSVHDCARVVRLIDQAYERAG